eukprot:6185199-Pleurochrysis_carterae.AAC.2
MHSFPFDSHRIRTYEALALRSPNFGFPACAWPPPPACTPTQSRPVGALSPRPRLLPDHW